MRIVMQKSLRICNKPRNLAFVQQDRMLQSPHGYARLDPDRCVTMAAACPATAHSACVVPRPSPAPSSRPAVMTKHSPARHLAPNGAGPAGDGVPARRGPWPPDPFQYLDGRLCVSGLPLDEVVAETGTPAYVYDLDAVAAAYRRVAAAFEPLGARVLYAVKANSNLAVLSTLAQLGSGFDVVSGGELVRVLRAGGDAEACVFASVGKTTEELTLAVGHGV